MDDPARGKLREGSLFGGRYRIVRPIKAGGMGAVYEVVDERTRGSRALKVMLPSMVSSAQQRARFEQEARLTGAIDSEHLVRVFDAGVDECGPFLVMELLRGEELQDLLDRCGKIGHEDVCRYLMQASRALDKTLAAGIVHRDIKPANLFLTHRDDGSPCLKVLDFGVAKLILPEAAKRTRALGTPLYMAPEQVNGEGDIDPRADLYALAHVAYSLLTGEPYWLEDGQGKGSSMQLLLRIVNGAEEPASLRALRRTQTVLPPGFDAWFAQATAADPARRFAAALEQTQALAALWSAAPGQSTPGFVAPRPAPSRPGDDIASSPTQWALTAHAPAPAPAPLAHASAPTLSASPNLAPSRAAAPASRGARPRGRSVAIALSVIVALAGGTAAAVAVGVGRSSETPRRRGASSAKPPPSSSAAASAAPSARVPPSKGCSGLQRCATFTPPVPANVEIALVIAETDKLARELDPDARWVGLTIMRIVGDSAADLTAGMIVQYGVSRGTYHVTVLPPTMVGNLTDVPAGASPAADTCKLPEPIKRARASGFAPGEPTSMFFSQDINGAGWQFNSERRTLLLDAHCNVKYALTK